MQTFNAQTALIKIAEIIAAANSARETPPADPYAEFDWDSIDTSAGEDIYETLWEEPAQDSTRNQMIAYAKLFSALNNYNTPESLIADLDYQAERDYPNNPYKHILAYAKFALGEFGGLKYVCPRIMLFNLVFDAGVDVLVEKMVNGNDS